jgi:hypothetical protein
MNSATKKGDKKMTRKEIKEAAKMKLVKSAEERLQTAYIEAMLSEDNQEIALEMEKQMNRIYKLFGFSK